MLTFEPVASMGFCYNCQDFKCIAHLKEEYKWLVLRKTVLSFFVWGKVQIYFNNNWKYYMISTLVQIFFSKTHYHITINLD